MLYQDIETKQKENQQAKLLAMQTRSLQRHIEQVENLYENLHSVRHNMTNHILTLERLYEGNHAEEAKAYSEALKIELAQMTGEIESGNPVTDVILLEFQKETAARGILSLQYVDAGSIMLIVWKQSCILSLMIDLTLFKECGPG